MEQKLIEIFQDILDLDTDIEQINSDHSAWDSMAHLNLILTLEEEFDINIPPKDFPQLHSDLPTILKYLEKQS